MECAFDSSDSWVVMSPIELQIKRKIEAVGVPLKKWNININYGIKTGLNEAFIITGKKREELILEDPKSGDIIRPILRGRDIKRYSHEFADLWLINTHNGLKETNVSYINIDDYPAIKLHLDQFYDDLERRADKGTTPYNLRNCAYTDDFSKQKIIYPEITKFLNFFYDTTGFMTNNKCFILTGSNIYFLTAFLNSSLFKFCFKDNFPELLGGSRELRKVFIEQLPVIKVNESTELIFKDLLDKITEIKTKKLNSTHLEKEVDNLIFDIYQLSEYEKEAIGFIEIR